MYNPSYIDMTIKSYLHNIILNNVFYVLYFNINLLYVHPKTNEDEDSFFDLLSRFQSERMDDQRCSLSITSENKENLNSNSPSFSNGMYEHRLIKHYKCLEVFKNK